MAIADFYFSAEFGAGVLLNGKGTPVTIRELKKDGVEIPEAAETGSDTVTAAGSKRSGKGKAKVCCNVLFEDGAVRTVPINELLQISEVVYALTGHHRGRRNYSYGTKTLPVRAVHTDMKPVFIVGDGKKEARLEAEGYDYRGNITCKCTCGYKWGCKHADAVNDFLRQHGERLIEAYVASEIGKGQFLFLSIDLTGKIEQFERQSYTKAYVEYVRKIAEEIRRAGSDEYTMAVLDTLFMQNEDDWYEAEYMQHYIPLIGAFVSEPEIRRIALDKDVIRMLGDGYESRQYRSNRAEYKRILKAYETAEKELKAGDYTGNIYKEFLMKYSGNGDQLLRYFEGKEDGLTFTETQDYLIQAAEELKAAGVKPEQVPRIGQIIRKIDSRGGLGGEKAITALIGLLSSREALDVCKDLTWYHLDLATYKNLPAQDRLLLMNSMGIDKDTVSYIEEEVLPGAEETAVAAYLFSVMEKTRSMVKAVPIRDIMVRQLNRLPDNTLLKLTAQVCYSSFDFSFYPSAGKKEIREEEISRYFCGDFEVNEEEEAYEIRYFLYPKNTQLKDSIILSENDKGSVRGTGVARAISPESVKRMIAFVRQGREDEIKAQTERVRESVDRKIFERTNRLFISRYDALVNDLNSERIVFTESFKATIRYNLQTTEDGKILLWFKVGNVRDYIVKNAYTFLKNFKERKTEKYGKDLTLTHEVENLREEDQPVIRMLTAMRFSEPSGDAYAKRFLPVRGALLSNLLQLLEGREICYNDEPLKVRMEERELKAVIDKHYNLSLKLEGKTCDLHFSDGKAFLFTKGSDGWTVDQLKGTGEEIALYEFIHANSGVSIRLILNDFRKNIYSRFFDSFEVDPAVRKDFRLSEIRINAYFDYEDKEVTLRTEILKDERPVGAENLTERADIGKLSVFEGMIRRLGFEEGHLRDEGDILSFLKSDFTELRKLASVYLSENLSSKKILSVGRQMVRVSGSGKIMEAFLERSDFSEEELEAILKGLRRHKKFIFLDNDRLVDLNTPEAKEFGETVTDLALDEKHLYETKKLSMVNALKAFAHENNCSIDRHLRTMIEDIRSYKDADIPVPELKVKLRGYQEEGYRWLKILSGYNMGGILADEMGLGKTLQIIALLVSDETPGASLVICPKSLVFNWMQEFARFDGTTKVVGIYGTALRRAELIRDIDYSEKVVCITSYDSLRNDIALYEGEFQYCILDEAQYIKNVLAQKSQSVKTIKAVHRFALTGTPIENTVLDLWSIFDFLMPGYFEDLSAFRSQYQQNEEFTARIAKRVGPFILRRVKAAVLSDLPQKYERFLTTEMTRDQRKLYDAVKLKANRVLEDGGKAFEMLPYLMRLRQICVDPAMYAENYEGESGKLKMLEELIPSYLEAGHRLLVFSQFVKGLNQMEKLLMKLGIPYYLLTGSTSARERASMIEAFNSAAGTDVFLISLKAGGTGVNLTGADTVIHLDPWWNTAAEEQASDRAHRIGQTRNVEVIRLIAEQSIEQRVIELQNSKKDIIDKIISDDESSVTGASLEDIRYILE